MVEPEETCRLELFVFEPFDWLWLDKLSADLTALGLDRELWLDTEVYTSLELERLQDETDGVL